MAEKQEIAQVGDTIIIKMNGYSHFFYGDIRNSLALVNASHEIIGTDCDRVYFLFEGVLRYIRHGQYRIIKATSEEERAKVGDLVCVKPPDQDVFACFHDYESWRVRVAISDERRIGVFYIGNVWYYHHGDYEIVKRAPEKSADTESKQEMPHETLDSYRLVENIALMIKSRRDFLTYHEQMEAELSVDTLRKMYAYDDPQRERFLFGVTMWTVNKELSNDKIVVHELTMPIYERYQRHTDFRSAPTCDLVDELVKREGVVEYAIPTPEHVYRVQSLDTRVDGATWKTLGPSIGPARILVVTD